ncbi:MAG: acetyl-CoA C-acyltransferase [Sphingobacteriales bacterium]|jgi:acetyl-CoA C-acetyltransferase
MKKEVFVVSAVRTPIGSFGGVLKSFSAIDLGAIAIKAAVEQSGIDKTKVDELLMGSVIQANLGQAPARQAARKAGLPDHVACTTVNKVCASGLKAIVQGAQSILLGDADVVVAGGMESMSNVPFYSEHMRWGNKYGHVQFLDGIARDGLIDAYDGKAMGVAAEKCASECGISREEQDTFAIESYRRAQKAWEEGNFTNEVIPVVIPQKKGDDVVVDKDEEPWNIKYDKVAGLRPAFIEGGTITAANASTMNDGAAAVVLVSGEKLKEWNLTPLAKIVSYADAEQAPEWFTTTPALALPRAIQKAGLNATDISYWEINEAFSVVGIENMRRLGVHHEQLNVHGGAVAIGHPLGCSGTRIIVSLIHILMQRSARYGAAGICNGGGGASAMVIENLAG